MTKKIGIPRGLLYYRYGLMWERFFEGLGLQVKISPPTDKKILSLGLAAAVDDICLPVKAYLGHVLTLAREVDFLFIPRLVSLSPDTYQCPKFLGLPDVVKSLLPDLPPVIDTLYNSKLPQSSLKKFLTEVGRIFVFKDDLLNKEAEAALAVHEAFINYLKAGKGFEQAFRSAQGKIVEDSKQKEERNRRKAGEKGGFLSPPVIALVGHPYNIYDDHLSVAVKKKLEALGASVVTPDQAGDQEIIYGCRDLPKAIYWQLNRETVGSAVSFLRSGRIHGLVHLNSFACGPDSFAKDLIDRRARRYKKVPYLSLILDEHTAETGLLTRLEAFMDMVNHLPKRGVTSPLLQTR